MMTARQALEVLAAHRANHVVITTMTAVGVWPGLSDTPLDFAYIPSAMGHAPAEAALGKAALDQLVFENAVSLYRIPVTLPQKQALASR